MNKLSYKGAAITILALLGAKFILVPLLAWQDNQIDRLGLKVFKLQKSLIASSRQDSFEEELSNIQSELNRSRKYFFTSGSSMRLTIQQEVEAIFSQNDLNLTGFNWLTDAPGYVTAHRATVFFKGSTAQMMGAFWDLSGHEKMISQIEWRQQIGHLGADQVDITSGSVMLEFYAIKEQSTKSRASSNELAL